MTIDLTISGISVSLKLFDKANYPRIAADNQSDVTYTATGVAVGNGKAYEVKHLWNVEAYCSIAQEQALRLIWTEHDYLRRTLQTCDILVVDKSQLFQERSPRTRAIAVGTTAIVYPVTGTTTHVIYYAQFKAWMTGEPKFSKVGIHRLASFSLYETVKVAA